MPDRSILYLKGACLVLASILVVQLAGLAGMNDALSDLETDSMAFQTSFRDPGNPVGQAKAAPNSRSLPAEIQSQVDRVRDSEIFGLIPRPQPMALLGIGGRDAFIQTPDGQSQLLQVGEEAGGVKLLEIGKNRVLVEHEGQRKELILYPDLSGATLLPNH